MNYCSTARPTRISATQVGPVPQLFCTIPQRRPSSRYRVGPSSSQYERSQEVSAVQREAMISTHVDLTRKVGAVLELTLASRTVLCLPVGHCPQVGSKSLSGRRQASLQRRHSHHYSIPHLHSGFLQQGRLPLLQLLSAAHLPYRTIRRKQKT